MRGEIRSLSSVRLSATMRILSVLSVSAITILAAACGGSNAEPAKSASPPTETPAPAPPAAVATTPAPTAPSASATAETPAATPPPSSAAVDPTWPGMTGENLEWAQKCSKGDATYCASTGNKYELSKKDYEHAMAAYKLGCDAKDADPVSCMGVGRLMIEGQGTTKNVDEGIKAWAKGCDLASGRDACWELAKAFDKGDAGLKKDPKRAKEFFTKACDKNMTNACTKIGKQPKK